MKKYICKICGFAMNEKIDVGTICPCCLMNIGVMMNSQNMKY